MEETSKANKDIADLEPRVIKEECQLPLTFLKRSKAKSASYAFSQHDNRHAFQLQGVYFGQGLGKKLVMDGRNQHKSDNIISWSDEVASQLSNSSTYEKNYIDSDLKSRKLLIVSSPSKKRKQLQHLAPVAVNKPRVCGQSSSDDIIRRFPRTYALPRSSDTLKTSHSWYVHRNHASNTYLTPLSVLAATQQPFLPPNSWKFSSLKQRTLHVGRRVVNLTC